jgi:drug/metabolite transporter (DMT)-like permease
MNGGSVMSSEGVTLVMRAALVVFLIIVTATVRTLVGPGRRRGRMMLAGTLGGISFGVLLTYPISQWLKADASVICVCLGMVLGWGVSWLFARQIPREAN